MIAVLSEDQPQGVHLGGFLLERHARQKIRCALVDRPSGILVGMKHE